MSKPKKHSQGFTLVELLVSVGIMAVIIIITLGIYMNVMKTRKESLGQIEIAQDGQNIINEMVKNIRRCRVAYSIYEDLGGIPENNVTSTLVLEDPGETATSTVTYIYYRRCSPDGEKYVIQKCHQETCDLSEDCDLENNFKTLTISGLNVDRMDFHINPKEDPYKPGTVSSSHPRVTIVIKLCSLRQGLIPAELIIQRTASQKWQFKK